MSAPSSIAPVSAPAKKVRLLSIDALRGFDMFWILGAEGVFAALFIITGFSWFNVAAEQMLHSQWHGFTFYDLIFPLFILLSGVSLGLAAKPISAFSDEVKREKYKHAFKRLVLLFALGILYNHGWGTGIPADIDGIRYVSVLGRIGLAWFIAAMVVWHFRLKIQIYLTAGLFVIYSLLLLFAGVGEFGFGEFGTELSLNAWVDQHFLPGIRYQNLAVDPEGILSNLGSIINCLVGVFIGRLMIQYKEFGNKLTLILLVIGVLCVSLGWLLNGVLPVNKTLWTPTFVLVTSGWSVLFLAAFYYLIDVLKWQGWAKPFAIIGMNSIIIYLATSLVNWQYLVQSLFGGLLATLSEGWLQLWTMVALLLVQWLLLVWMYKHKIFVKV